jgi:hypothetical protein
MNAGVPAEGSEERVLLLACGREAALVWDRAAAGTPPDGHERDCPHCSAAFADARGLDVVVHRLAAEELEPSASMMDRVMATVLTELRPYDVLTLPSPHGGVLLSEPAAARVLRHVVDRMEGLRARSCRIEQRGAADPVAPDRDDDRHDGDQHDGDQHGPHAADVAISVTARFGVDLASVTARVRQMVIAAGEQALGIPVRRVDIDVVDLFGEGTS